MADDSMSALTSDCYRVALSCYLGSAYVNPSVLILSEELTFLLSCYSSLHQDERIGRVEAATSREEAAKLLQTFRPDAVVIDSSAGDNSGFSAVMRDCRFSSEAAIIVTCDERDGPAMAPHARAIGAVGFLRRDNFSAAAVVRAVYSPAAHRA